MGLLQIHNLKVYYSTLRGKVKAVDGISFDLEKNEIFGLVGESGCGKSTAMLSILGLLPPGGKIVGGKILFEGEDLARKNEAEMKSIRWKKISMVPQASMNALNPVVRVRNQIVEAILAHESIAKTDAVERAEELLDMVGIARSRASSYPFEYSGGMKQRAIMAMALACSPNIVIADEPTTALDVIVQAKVIDLIIDLQKKLNFSILWVTHDLSLISAICDRVCIMYAGKVVEVGDAQSVFTNPLCKYTQLLIQSIPTVKETKNLVHIPGAAPDLVNPPVGCRFHPRCPYAEEICRKEEPQLIETKKRHYAACYSVK